MAPDCWHSRHGMPAAGSLSSGAREAGLSCPRLCPSPHPLKPDRLEPDVSSGTSGWSFAVWISTLDAGLAEGHGQAEWSLAKVRIHFLGGTSQDRRRESPKSQDGNCPGPDKECDLGVMVVGCLSRGAVRTSPQSSRYRENSNLKERVKRGDSDSHPGFSLGAPSHVSHAQSLESSTEHLTSNPLAAFSATLAHIKWLTSILESSLGPNPVSTSPSAEHQLPHLPAQPCPVVLGGLQTPARGR